MKRTQAKDMYDRTWITTNAIELLEEYENGTVTLRGLSAEVKVLSTLELVKLYISKYRLS